MLQRILAAGRLAQATLLLGGLVVAVVASRFMDDPAPVGEGEVTGTVISVATGELEGRASTTPVASALVELPDGGRTRVFLAQPWPATGQDVRLHYTEYADGSRRYAHDPLP